MLTNLHSTVRALALGALAGIALLAAGCSQGPSTDKIGSGDMSAGKADAPITVVEYASVACPICARMNQAAMSTFMSKYVDTGKVHYIYRPMMTGNPAVSVAGHLLAQCAGPDKSFKVVDAIMRSQEEMDQGSSHPEEYANARTVLTRIAQSVGLTDEQFNKCVTDPKGVQALNDAHDKAIKDGVDGTPTFFVNGKKIPLQKYDMSDLDNAIQPLLKK
ncbi:thioredoxin domain-containing protein [Asticcacaulis solisilvae]|uniref:thioredoxin domain-containing protein n=1 Tax=Asticcacaulis solisilvae TaxID=1217274 RepID=UPI003FD87C1A